MTDAISVLKLSNGKLRTKVEKLRAQLEAAETELAEGETAVRVLKKLGLSPAVDGPADSDGKLSSQDQVRAALPTDEGSALTPREVHQALSGAISADNVRTVLSRLKNTPGSDVTATDGRYWRKVEEDTEWTDPATSDDFADFRGVRMPPADDDLDSDVPF